jgi:multidrug resistance protein, MATE family
MIAAIEQPFMALSMIFGGSLKGLGDTKTPFIVSLLSSWVIRLPLMFYFV